MAEALAIVGVVSSIVQLVDFSTKVVNRLDDFVTSVDEVPRAFRHIKTELPLIVDSLRRIQDQARAGSVDKATIDAVDPVIKDCHHEITRLETILDKTVPSVGASSWDRRRKAFLSLGKDKHVEEIAESLGRYVRVLTLHQAVEGSKPDLQPPPQNEPAKPKYFTLIPFDRNSNFVEREDLFKQIDESFKVKEGSQPKAALFGLGGIGKSQIALEYCFKHRENDPKCSIFWIHAATLARFEETYKRIATECGLIKQEDAQVDVTQLVQNWLESRHEGRWLMVIDNVDDADVFFREATGHKKTLSQYIPRTGKGSLLFTTRRKDIAVDLILPTHPIAVPFLTKSEGGRLLRSRVQGDHSEEHVVELLEELEYIPLAITQAAAFMSKRRRTISQYLELYRKSDSARVRMLSCEFSDHGRQYNSMESVAKTWILSFESIRRGNPRSADLLSLMAYFDRHAIPSALLYDDDEDLFDFEDAVAVLIAFYLIKSDEAGSSFDMHNLVQLATKSWLIYEKKCEEDKWAFEALNLLARKFPAPQHHPSAEYWTLCASFLPHAQLILANSFKTQRDEIELTRATLLLSVARYIHWRGAIGESKVKTEESFSIRERILGEKNQETLRSLGQFAWVCPQIGMEVEGVEAGRRCLKLRQEVLGDEHPETLDSLSDLASCLVFFKEYQDSEVMQRTAYEGHQRVLGREHPDTLNCLSHLASVLDDVGRYEEAEVASRESIRLKTKGIRKSSSVFSDLNNLALILYHQHKYDEAEEVYRRALALEEEQFGKTHGDTLVTLSNLLVLLKKRQKLYEIRELSGWFKGETVIQEVDNPRALQAMRTLKRLGFYGPGSESSDGGYDAGYNDEEDKWGGVEEKDGHQKDVEED